MLFDVAIVKVPTQKEAEEGKMEELVVPPTTVVAVDEASATINVAVANADKLASVPKERLTVYVRPFCVPKR